MERLRSLVSSGDRNITSFDTAAAAAEAWECDGRGTQVYVIWSAQLIVLKIRSHQGVGGSSPSRLTVGMNVLADREAGRGRALGEVARVVTPVIGPRYFLRLGGVAVVGYVSKVVRELGYGQAARQLRNLGQQGVVACLEGRVGTGYYEPGREVWSYRVVRQFGTAVWGSRKVREEKARGRTICGTGGVVRAWSHRAAVARMMGAVSADRRRWGGYAEGEDQVRDMCKCWGSCGD